MSKPTIEQQTQEHDAVPVTSGGVDRQPVAQLTTHWELSPAGRPVASWSPRPAGV